MAGFDEFDGEFATDDRLAGTQGYMLFNGSDDQGANGLQFMTPPVGRGGNFPFQPFQPTFVPIRSWAARIDRRFTDVTSGVHYSPDHGVTFSAQIPNGIGMEIKADGVFHLDSITQTILIALYDGGSLTRVILGFDDLHQFFEGDCMVSNFLVTSAINDVISYSCILRPYGVFSTLIEAFG